ncbi:MAG: DUF6361 family protein, partial [Rhodobacterales bacterium]|nr:DUF6361 family protein [Rhodobacterales bacterium]
MSSYISWVDFDPEARQKARELLALSKSPNARDELGLATLRDGISDALFPATSTIHTKLRYMFFIPWLAQIAHQENRRVSNHFETLEYDLIKALKKGHSGDGIIGGTTGDSLKRLPSSVYWAALESLGIRNLRGTIGSLLSDNAGDLRKNLWHADLPAAPKGLLKAVSFRLEPHEKAFFLGRLQERAKSSLFNEIVSSHKLVSQLRNNDGTPRNIAPWDLIGVSPPNAHLLEQARIFSDLMHGAALLYNLLLIRKAAQDKNAHMFSVADRETSELEKKLADWQSVSRLELQKWDVRDLDALQNRKVKPGTLPFISRWQELVLTTDDLTTSGKTEDFITKREYALKWSQKKARLSNQDALRRWS